MHQQFNMFLAIPRATFPARPPPPRRPRFRHVHGQDELGLGTINVEEFHEEARAIIAKHHQ
jgi:hypothetical protein